jgi:hypothetical protein
VFEIPKKVSNECLKVVGMSFTEMFGLMFSLVFWYILQGNLLTTEVADSKDSCLKNCKSYTNCHWYSYKTVNHLCLLLSTCPVIDESEVEFASGETGCPTSFSMLFVCLFVFTRPAGTRTRFIF